MASCAACDFYSPRTHSCDFYLRTGKRRRGPAATCKHFRPRKLPRRRPVLPPRRDTIVYKEMQQRQKGRGK